MTKAAKHFGKDLSHFVRSPVTKEYVEAMQQTANYADCSIVQAKRGGSTPGTWCHPKLAVFFARWLDVRFAVWCDLMIDNILKGNLVVAIKEWPGESRDGGPYGYG